MFGFSYGEIFLILGAAAALIWPKDLPAIARTAGRLAGRAIGYVQLARGHFDTVMQQSQARRGGLMLLRDWLSGERGIDSFEGLFQYMHDLHSGAQGAAGQAQLETIRHEIRSISLLHPGPLIQRIGDNIVPPNATHEAAPGAVHTEDASKSTMGEVSNEETHRGIVQAATNSKVSNLCDMHSQAAAYSRLADSSMLQSGSLRSGADAGELIGNSGLLNVLPISAESTGMLPNHPGDMKGSDIVLEAILEAEVAHNAKSFLDSLKIG